MHQGRFFVDCLGFLVTHDELASEQPFCVIKKRDLRINLFQNEILAKQHIPEFRLVTDDIDEVFQKVSSSHAHFLHPNLKTIQLRPWGAKEFALTDKQVGIVIQQW